MKNEFTNAYVSVAFNRPIIDLVNRPMPGCIELILDDQQVYTVNYAVAYVSCQVDNPYVLHWQMLDLVHTIDEENWLHKCVSRIVGVRVHVNLDDCDDPLLRPVSLVHVELDDCLTDAAGFCPESTEYVQVKRKNHMDESTASLNYTFTDKLCATMRYDTAENIEVVSLRFVFEVDIDTQDLDKTGDVLKLAQAAARQELERHLQSTDMTDDAMTVVGLMES